MMLNAHAANKTSHRHATDGALAFPVARCATGFTRVGTEAVHVTSTCQVSTDPNANPDWRFTGTCVKGEWATIDVNERGHMPQ
jgi:hypothetical protein